MGTNIHNFSFRILNIDEHCDISSLTKNIPFTQNTLYDDWQRAFGRTVARFAFYENDSLIAYAQAIKYPLFKNKQCLYIPYGPIIKESSEELLAYISTVFKDFSKQEKVVFVRFDFTFSQSTENQALKKYFKPSPQSTYHSSFFQPRVEWALDITPSTETLLKNMHKNTRYSINVAEKKGVRTEIITNNFKKYFPYFWRLISETAERNKFSLHKKAYYESLFESMEQDKNCFLTIAIYQGAILVVDVMIVSGTTTTYVFGASSTLHRDTMPSYQAQWKAIQHARNIGCTVYNFGGIATEDNQNKNWKGLTAFKQRFGGYKVRHSPFYDTVNQPIVYGLYCLKKYISHLHS
jgi:peptidoglycan pentaglycine glycine transferase (the first glycine)